MAKKTTAISGTITLDLDRRPDVPQDSDRLSLAIEQIPAITDDDSYVRVAEIVKTCAQRIKTITSFFEPMKKSSHQAHKTICDSEKKLSSPFAKIREVGEERMGVYREAKDEAKTKQETDIQASGQELKDELLAKAKQLRREGDIKGAKELERQAEQVITDIVLPDSAPEVDGMQDRRTWTGICERPMDLIVAVAEGRVPLMHTVKVRGGEIKELPVIEINDAVLQYYASTLTENLPQKLPGCKAKHNLKFAVTGGKED